MNYRHAFHAGNFADVLKHAVLALVIEHLKLKPKPFRVIDTHAGIGRYRLDGPEALRTSEWRDGIGRLIGPAAAPLPADVAALLAPYLETIRKLNPDGDLAIYPGSPLLALSLMRADDRLVAAELHPEDSAELARLIGRDPRARIFERDGWQVLKASLPPRERRGIVLIDPPYEVAGESARLAQALREGLKRFATGTYLLWFPLKDRGALGELQQAIASIAIERVLWVELAVGAPKDKPGALSGSGLAILNPPYRLAEQLNVLLPFLAERLSRGEQTSWSVRDPRLGAQGNAHSEASDSHA
ncbi:MAG: 23S rRNA (adenine(2030)-N(6))-methyltransferase RlmJ [Hyphomicrobiaceae bacterium]